MHTGLQPLSHKLTTERKVQWHMYTFWKITSTKWSEICCIKLYINLRMSAYWKTLLNSPIPPIPHQVVAAILLISTPIALVWALHMRQNLSVFYSSAVYSVFRPPVRSGYTCVLYTVSQTSVQNNRRFCRMLLSSSWTCTCSDVSSLRPKQNGRHFPDDTFKRIFFNENFD